MVFIFLKTPNVNIMGFVWVKPCSKENGNRKKFDKTSVK